MTKPTASTMKAALTKIANMDLGLSKDEMLELSHADAVDMIVTLAKETLNPVSGPSAMERKTKEVTDFIMKDFALAFASNDDIGEKLNAAGILSPAGKPWTRSNVSKVMSNVKEAIAAQMNAKNTTAPATEPKVSKMTPEDFGMDGANVALCGKTEAEPVVEAAPVAPEPVAVGDVIDMEPAPVAEVAPAPETAGTLTVEDELLAELADLDELTGIAAE